MRQGKVTITPTQKQSIDNIRQNVPHKSSRKYVINTMRTAHMIHVNIKAREVRSRCYEVFLIWQGQSQIVVFKKISVSMNVFYVLSIYI
jgi:hypothetical protein